MRLCLLINKVFRSMNSQLEKINYRLHPYLRINAPRVKVLSPLRSGSNWLEKLLYKNFKVVVQAPYQICWKHDYPDVEADVKKIIIMREPNSWLVSFYDWERIHGRVDENLNVYEFASRVSNQPDIVKYHGDITPIDYWNRFLEISLSLAESLLLVSHDHLTQDADKVIRKISLSNDWQLRKGKVRNFPIRADWWNKPNFLPPLSSKEKINMIFSLRSDDLGFNINGWKVYSEISRSCFYPKQEVVS